MDLYTVIVKPIITEKSMAHATEGKFTFQVARKADKHTIKKAIESKFNVHVVDIATSQIKARTKRGGFRRTKVTEPAWKKAVVKVRRGEKIDLFEVPKQ